MTALRPPPMYSQTAEYAISLLARMACEGEKTWSASDLAEALSLPHDYLAKILVRLRDGQFVDSQRGRSGGYRLARAPSAITLADIVAHLEQPEEGRVFCNLSHDLCGGEKVCALHHYRLEVAALRERILRDTSIADMALHDDPKSDCCKEGSG